MLEQSEKDLGRTLDSWPPPLTTLVLSLQWLVVLVPGLLVLGDVAATAWGLDPAGKVAFLQRLLLLTALAQAVQVLWGHRLPGQVGPSAVLLVGMLATASSGWGAVMGAMAVGGGLTAMAGVLGLGNRLAKLYTPPVLASTLLLIAVGLSPTLLNLLFDPATAGASLGGSFLYALVLVLAMLWAQSRLGGLAGSSVLLLGLAAGSLAYHLLGLGPRPVWPAGPEMGLPALDPRGLELEISVIFAFFLCNLALIANELGSVESLCHILNVKQREARVRRAVAWGGLFGLLSGLMGSVGPVTYSLSPGVVLASRNASRFTLLPTALMAGLLAFWPGGLALFHLAPPPVVGAVLVALMAHTIYAALSLLVPGGRPPTARDGLVVGASMIAGVTVSFMPPAVAEALHPYLRPLLANGFVVGLILAMLLEHVFLRPARGGAEEG